MSSHDAKAVAVYFLKLAETAGRGLTPMHVLKLVYIAHGWMLAIHNQPLFRNRVEAWEYGPVIPALYQAVKRFGAGEIDEPIDARVEKFTEDERAVMDRVSEVYGGLGAFQLSALTHRQGTPWYSVWHEQGGRGVKQPISNEAIREHYLHLSQTRSAR